MTNFRLTLVTTGAALLLLSLATACGASDDPSPADASTDGASPDAAPTDGGSTDAGPRDLGPADGGPRDLGPRDGGPRDLGPIFRDGGFPLALPVNLGGAGNFVILAKTGISTVPISAVTGNVGLSPAAASFITGFSLTADSTNVFSRSTQVTGMVYAANYEPPTPSNLTTAVSDMLLAFTDAAGRAPDVTELGAGDISGQTLPRGVYKWGTGLLLTADLTLAGSATDVWIFQIGADLTMTSGVQVHLTGGALPENVFWQVAGLVDLGTTAHAEGIILCQTGITLRTGASINGRLLAQTAVNIDGSTVVQP